MVVVGLIVPEVLRGLGYGLAIEADHDTTEFLIAVRDVEIDLRSLLGCL